MFIKDETMTIFWEKFLFGSPPLSPPSSCDDRFSALTISISFHRPPIAFLIRFLYPGNGEGGGTISKNFTIVLKNQVWIYPYKEQ